MRAVALAASIVVLMTVMMAGIACADEAAAPAPPTAPEGQQVAQAPEAAPAPTASSVPQRVEALEKQNLVLSEDLGKAQLKARDLEEVTKQQAAAIAKLNQQLAEEQKKAESERQKQAMRNRYMWFAVGLVAIATIGR